MPLRRFSSSRGRKLRFDEAVLERFIMTGVGYQYLLRLAPRIDRVVIPRTNGRLSSAGVDKVGLVTTTGAKSGQARTQPLAVIDDGEGPLLIASNYGRPTHPSWSANLIAHPDCEVEFRGPKAPFRAQLLDGEERAKAWATAVDWYAGYERYRAKCAPRVIRVFRLTPR
jgi:deazaflavin-dependent oxidoreductase (nitroreductase family)